MWDCGIAYITGQSRRELDPFFDVPFGEGKVQDVDVDVKVDSEVNL
jgi:hypothetical protein